MVIASRLVVTTVTTAKMMSFVRGAAIDFIHVDLRSLSAPPAIMATQVGTSSGA